MKKNNIVDLYESINRTNVENFLKPFGKCLKRCNNLYKTRTKMYMLMYDSENKKADRMLLLGGADEYDYMDIYFKFRRISSCEKYNNPIGSRLFKLYGRPMVNLEDLLDSGLRAVRVFEDGKFTELKERDVRKKSIFVFEPYFGMDKDAMEVLVYGFQAKFKKDGMPIFDALQSSVYNFVGSADVTKVAMSLYIYWEILLAIFEDNIKIWGRLDTNFALRSNGRLIAGSQDRWISDADFSGSDYDSADFCEADIMLFVEGGSEECLSFICNVTGLDNKVLEKVIRIMLSYPKTPLNEVFAEKLVERSLKHNYFADRYIEIEGPSVVFRYAFDEDMIGMVADITQMP